MAGRECPQCAEPLMGAVNRCWKCGLDLRAETRPGAVPVSSTAHEPVIIAEIAEPTSADTETPLMVPQPVTASVSEPAVGASTVARPKDAPIEFGPNGAPLRRGSPFATGALLLPPREAPSFAGAAKKKPPSLQSAYASNGGAIAALVLGVFGLIIAPFRFEGAIVGLLGLIMGLWGLYSQRRGWALLGLILCCLAIAIGMYTGVFWMFQVMNNATPWEY